MVAVFGPTAVLKLARNYRTNREQSYCQYVIRPKLGKLGLEQ